MSATPSTVSNPKQRAIVRLIMPSSSTRDMSACEEAKLVRCTRGALYDVIVDLRSDSPTYLKICGVRLDSENRLMLFIPERFAHGFITLEDGTEVLYQMSEFYAPGSSRGIRWNDPVLGIQWPIQPTIISERDQSYPDLEL